MVNKESLGVRVSVVVHFDTAIRQLISMDINFEDDVISVFQELISSALIDVVSQAEIMAYSLDSVVMEKSHAMIMHFQTNSHMKGPFDVCSIGVESEVLSYAIKSTFADRETNYRENHPLFTEEFFSSKDRQSFWNGFLWKIKYPESIDFH